MATGSFGKGRAGIRGHDGVHTADVFLSNGIRELQVKAGPVTIQSLLGEAVFPFTATKILTLGSNGNTIRTQIAGPIPVDVTTTKTASELKLNDLAEKHTDELNADTNFKILYESDTPRDSHEVCITSRLIQTIRNNSGDVIVTPTGGITVELFKDKIFGHPLALALIPHPDDCTKGTVSILGSVSSVPQGKPPKRILLHDSGGSPAMNINASSDEVFKLSLNTVDYDSSNDFLVTELRIETAASSILIGADDKYIEVSELTGDGHHFEIRSAGSLAYDEKLFTVNDIHHAYVIGEGSRFDLQESGSGTSLVAIFARPFFIRRAGSFITDDDIIVTLGAGNDLSTSSIKRLQVSVVGFED